MRKVIIIHILFLLQFNSVFANNFTDSTIQRGWLVYVDEIVFWLPAEIEQNQKTCDFFRNNFYNQGAEISSFKNEKAFKNISKRFDVKSGTKKIKTQIFILPVEVKLKKLLKGATQNEQEMLFFKGKKEVNIKYWYLAPYTIGEFRLFRKKDQKRFNRSKKAGHFHKD